MEDFSIDALMEKRVHETSMMFNKLISTYKQN